MRNPLPDPRLPLLRSARDGKLPRRIEPNDARLRVAARLIEEELLDGWVSIGPDHQPLRVIDPRLTLLGHDYLQQAEEEESLDLIQKRTAWSRAQETAEVDCSLVSRLAIAVVFVILLFICLASLRGDSQQSARGKTEPTIVRETYFTAQTFGVCGPPPVE